MTKAVLSLVILVVVVILMLIDKIPSTTLALTAAVVCCALGMYNFKDIMKNVGSTTAVLIISLSILGAALFHSGLAQKIANGILKVTGHSERGVILGILIASILLSAISSNTAVVLMMIPLVKCLSQELDISLKRTMFPLAIGAGLGGGITLIGGTSNVAGNQVLADAHLPTMGFCSLGWVGIPVAVVSVILIVFLGDKLTPKVEGGYDGEKMDLSVMNTKGNKRKMIITGIITLGTVVAMMISTSALFVAALIGAILVIFTGCVSEKDAFDAVDIKMLILISSFSVISDSITNTGGDKLIAKGFVKMVGPNASPILICAALFFVTALLTQFLSNIVAIMMMGPIAISIATALAVNPVSMVMTVIIAGNACFATPFGSPYLTIMMPTAGYKFKDYLKMGTPFVILYWIATVIIVPLVWPFKV